MNENDGWFQKCCEIECGKEFMYLVCVCVHTYMCTPDTLPRQLDVTLHEIEFWSVEGLGYIHVHVEILFLKQK